MNEILKIAKELDELAHKMLFNDDPALRGEVSGLASLLRIEIELFAKFGIDTRK